MATIDRILIPTDFSEGSEKAYKFADTLVSAYGGVIDLIHVIPNVIYKDEQIRSWVGLADPEKELYPHLFNEAELKLNKIMKQFVSPKNRGDVFVKVDRRPSEVISDYGTEGNYSMIIMSALGKDESGMFRGNTTEQVVRRSKVPVMIVDEQFDPAHVETILVPTDGSFLSMAAIPTAIKLADTLGSSITLLYVNEMYGLLYTNFSGQSKRIDHEITENLVNRLQEFSNETGEFQLSAESKGPVQKFNSGLNGKKVSITARIEIVTGLSAHNEIIKYAKNSADLIIMTTHGRSGLANMIIGSNAEKVALNLDKSVLTIRPESKLFKD